MTLLPRVLSALLLSMFVFVGGGGAAEPGPRLAKGLLWKITGGPIPATAAPSHLFATIHLADRRVTRLAAPLRTRLDRSKVFAGELLMGPKTAQIIAQSLIAPPGQPPLDQLIGQHRTRILLRELAKLGVPATAVPRFKPWALAIMLAMPAQDPTQVLDSMLQTRATKRGLTITALETAAEQMAAFDAMGLELQTTLLAQTIDMIKDLPAQQKSLLNAYLSRDLNRLDATARQLTSLGSAEVARHFEVKVNIERNHRMIKRMIPLLKNGGAFIAVGALHLPGQQGLISLLRQHGYQVTPVF